MGLAWDLALGTGLALVLGTGRALARALVLAPDPVADPAWVLGQASVRVSDRARVLARVLAQGRVRALALELVPVPGLVPVPVGKVG